MRWTAWIPLPFFLADAVDDAFAAARRRGGAIARATDFLRDSNTVEPHPREARIAEVVRDAVPGPLVRDLPAIFVAPGEQLRGCHLLDASAADGIFDDVGRTLRLDQRLDRVEDLARMAAVVRSGEPGDLRLDDERKLSDRDLGAGFLDPRAPLVHPGCIAGAGGRRNLHAIPQPVGRGRSSEHDLRPGDARRQVILERPAIRRRIAVDREAPVPVIAC